jgi:hypothetical protein
MDGWRMGEFVQEDISRGKTKKDVDVCDIND